MLMSLIFVLVFISLGLVENILHQRRLKRVPTRILVNGTRGKTTVARMVASALNESGIRTICRTTGSEAQLVLPDGTVQPFKRRFGARITEMIPLLRTCTSQNAECLVVECMALGEENQRTLSNILVRPTHVIITNSFVDHVAEIGETKEETVWTLSQSIYPGSKVFVTESEYMEYCKDKESECTVANPYTESICNSNMEIHQSNAGVAIALCASLGVPKEIAIRGFAKATGDIGLRGNITGKGNSILIPSFSINDQTCMDNAIKDAAKENPGKAINVVFNNRRDREYRILLMDRVLCENKDLISTVYCIGDYPVKVMRHFEKNAHIRAVASDVEDVHRIIDLACGEVFVGLGNIKGSGEALIGSFSEGSGK